MGVFREDHKIRVTKLTHLWVAEGIMRPAKDKRLEEVAEEYIKELIDRNLIVDELRWNGRAKFCKIHDLLRDLCLREAEKQGFLSVLKHLGGTLPCMNMVRRVCIHDNTEEIYSPDLESACSIRSLIATIGFPELVQTMLLRVYAGDYNHSVLDSVEAIFQKVNLRLLTIVIRLPKISRFPSSWFLFWNLQTLKVDIPLSWRTIIAPCEIWEMPLLGHIMIKRLELPDPLCGENGIILEDLQTLSFVSDLKLSGAVLKKIPNIKTLKLLHQMSGVEAECHIFGLNNIGHLMKLQTLHLAFGRNYIFDGEIFRRYLMETLSFLHSLKKLTLSGTGLNWEDCTTKIGTLPLPQFLKLGVDACFGSEWETVEGQFCSLKFLHLEHCDKLRNRITEDTHFPRLEHLVIQHSPELEEIPSSIGDIPTLKSIWLDGCSTSAEDSAKGIQEEQLELGNTDFQLTISASGGQNPTMSDYLSYFEEVEDAFRDQVETYYRFHDVVNDIRAERIEGDDATREMNVLFKDHPNLIHGFNKVFPQYKITYTDEEEAP